MKREEMNRLVGAEMEGIPKGDEYQQALRMLYNAARRRNLGPRSDGPKTPREVADKCIASVRKNHPDAQFRLDPAVFGNPD
ncbi:MAG TPA: hypothetical protein VD866_21370 [Urbifossiella sp.]|nr:hypothetical protein [Urbifossiella sp.]